MKKALSAIIALSIAFLLLSCNSQIQNKGEDSTGNNPAPQVEAWSITQDRLDTETVMLVSTDSLITKTESDANVTVTTNEQTGIKTIEVKSDIQEGNITILEGSKVTFTPKSQAAPASKAAKETAEYEIVAEIKAKISSTSNSSGSTTQEKELNVSYKATTSDSTNLTDIKTEEITTTVGDKEVYKSTSTPTALLVKSYDEQIDKMILDYVKGNQVSGFDVDVDVDEERSFYSMGKGWIYFKSTEDNEYHKVNFTIEGKGIDGEYTITSKTFDGWCESTDGEEGLKVSEHPAVKDEDTEMPLSDQDIIDLTAQLYAYFIRYIPMKYDQSSGGEGSLPGGITPEGEEKLEFKSYKETDFFDTEKTINGTISKSGEISADLKDFSINGENYDILIGGYSDGSYVGGQATYAYITADGKEYSYNYLVDEIYKVCVRVYATSSMAGKPVSVLYSKDGTKFKLEDEQITLAGLYYSGTLTFYDNKTRFETNQKIEDTAYGGPRVEITGSGTISNGNINWKEADLSNFGKCTSSELAYINKLMEVEFKN